MLLTSVRIQSCESGFFLPCLQSATSERTQMEHTSLCASTSFGSAAPGDRIKDEPDFIRELQNKLSIQKKESIKLKSQIHNCQLTLEQQDEQLQALHEKIAKIKAKQANKAFNWSTVKAAHLISKVFENCEPVIAPSNERQLKSIATEAGNSANLGSTDVIASYTNNILPKVIGKSENIAQNQQKCLYTIEFHRFAIALYFFSPATYYYLSNIIPMFPHRNYIRQWVTAGRVEKLFPPGVYREEFDS